LLIEELVAIAERRNRTDIEDVFERLADSVPAAALATALAGP
jgi:hypothetical protein